MASTEKGLSPKQQAATWRDDFLDCRDIGHAWTRRNLEFRDKDRIVVRLWDCARCTVRRLESIDRRSGDVMARGYTYPDGYQSKAGRVSKSMVRAESISRILATRKREKEGT